MLIVSPIMGLFRASLKNVCKPSNISETAISARLSIEAKRLLQKNEELTALVDGASISCVIADHTSPSDFATGSSSKRPDLVGFTPDFTAPYEKAAEAD